MVVYLTEIGQLCSNHTQLGNIEKHITAQNLSIDMEEPSAFTEKKEESKWITWVARLRILLPFAEGSLLWSS